MAETRFEYRVWSPGAEELTVEVIERGLACGEKTSSDTYFLVPGDPAIGIKIRGGRLQVKQRGEIRTGLEQWTALLSAGFPVLADSLPTELARRRRGATREIETPEALLRQMQAKTPGVRGVRVLKHRRFYDVEGCRTEVARIQVHASILICVGIDDADPDRLLSTVQLLGADKFPNAGYPEKLLSHLSDDSNGQQAAGER